MPAARPNSSEEGREGAHSTGCSLAGVAGQDATLLSEQSVPQEGAAQSTSFSFETERDFEIPQRTQALGRGTAGQMMRASVLRHWGLVVAIGCLQLLLVGVSAQTTTTAADPCGGLDPCAADYVASNQTNGTACVCTSTTPMPTTSTTSSDPTTTTTTAAMMGTPAPREPDRPYLENRNLYITSGMLFTQAHYLNATRTPGFANRFAVGTGPNAPVLLFDLGRLWNEDMWFILEHKPWEEYFFNDTDWEPDRVVSDVMSLILSPNITDLGRLTVEFPTSRNPILAAASGRRQGCAPSGWEYALSYAEDHQRISCGCTVDACALRATCRVNENGDYAAYVQPSEFCNPFIPPSTIPEETSFPWSYVAPLIVVAAVCGFSSAYFVYHYYFEEREPLAKDISIEDDMLAPPPMLPHLVGKDPQVLAGRKHFTREMDERDVELVTPEKSVVEVASSRKAVPLRQEAKNTLAAPGDASLGFVGAEMDSDTAILSGTLIPEVETNWRNVKLDLGGELSDERPEPAVLSLPAARIPGYEGLPPGTEILAPELAGSQLVQAPELLGMVEATIQADTPLGQHDGGVLIEEELPMVEAVIESDPVEESKGGGKSRV